MLVAGHLSIARPGVAQTGLWVADISGGGQRAKLILLDDGIRRWAGRSTAPVFTTTSALQILVSAAASKSGRSEWRLRRRDSTISLWKHLSSHSICGAATNVALPGNMSGRKYCK